MRLPTLDEVRAEKQRRTYQRSLSAFVRDAWPVLEPNNLLKWNWHHDAMCEHLMAQSHGEIRNLGINVPPRSAKSTIVSVCWPAWEWTWNPAQQWLCGSYAGGLALDLALMMRRLVESDWYQRWWGHVFQLTEDQRAKGKFDTDKGGHRISVGAGGPVLGRGGNRLVMDDPHNTKQAESEDVREGTVDWYQRFWEGRLNDPQTGTRTLVMQRLHQHDVSGALIDRGDYEWLVLPMEFEPARRHHTTLGWTDPRKQAGELLHEARDGTAEVTAAKTRLGTYGYAGQMQQRPSPSEGGMFKRQWWRRWRPFASPPKEGVVMAPAPFDRKVISVDCAFKDHRDQPGSAGKTGKQVASSRVCVMTLGVHGPNKYIIRVVADQMDILQTIQAIRDARKADPDAYAVLVEDKANGPAVVQMLKREMPGVLEVSPRGDKVARATAVMPQVEAGNVLLLDGAPWVAEFIEEHAKFPAGTYKDQVDTLSQAVIWLDDPSNGGGEVLAMAMAGMR
jgi:predicted phage terminase large subunit-like protein